LHGSLKGGCRDGAGLNQGTVNASVLEADVREAVCLLRREMKLRETPLQIAH